MTKRMGRRLGENVATDNGAAGSGSSDQDVLLQLKNMAQEILDLQTTVAVRQKQSESTKSPNDESQEQSQNVQQQMAGLGNSTSLSNTASKEGRLLRRSSSKLSQTQPLESMEQKVQQLSELRYELSNELEVSLKNLQKVMKKSQDIVSEMNELLKQQDSGKQT